MRSSRLRWPVSSPKGRCSGPAGGGFLLLRDTGARADAARLLLRSPLAAAGPDGRGRDRLRRRLDAGLPRRRGSVAVPGLVAGLAEAHESTVGCPGGQLFDPALELARTGVEMSGAAAVSARDPGADPRAHRSRTAIYARMTRAQTAEMVPGLERLRADGAAAVAELVPELAADIAAYRVIERSPLEASFRRHARRHLPAAVARRRRRRRRACRRSTGWTAAGTRQRCAGVRAGACARRRLRRAVRGARRSRGRRTSP